MLELSTSNLSEILAVTKRTIQRRANREGWQYTEQIGLGGIKKIYEFASLPVDVRQQVISQIFAKHKKQGLEYQPAQSNISTIANIFNVKQNPFIELDKMTDNNWLSQHSFAHQLDNTQINKGYIKTGLLVLAHLYIAHTSFRKIKGFDQFCRLYNARELALHELIYSKVKRLSRITLIRCEKELESKGLKQKLFANTDKNELLFEEDLQQIAKQMLMISPNLSAQNLRQYFLTIYDSRKLPSASYLGQWLKSQKQTHNQLN